MKTKKIGTKTFVVDTENNIRHCDACEKKLELDKVGSIAHGSLKIFCDNPLCLSTWVAEKKIL